MARCEGGAKMDNSRGKCGRRLDVDQLLTFRDNIVAARTAYTMINQITNSLRREPGDTVKLKTANESMEFYLRNLEELIEELDVDGAVKNSHGT